VTKFSLSILAVLCSEDVTVASKSLSIPQILELMSEPQRKSYSTTYRHLLNMVKQGYVKCGLDDGAASTYYLSSSGVSFYQSQN